MTTTYRISACVWELTLACNARCIHCGSSAGAPRIDELTTDEAFRLVEELAALGTESITLSGGEPTLRSDWFDIASAIHASGMRVELITNGLSAVRQADKIKDADFFGVTFSVDGPHEIHDHLRGRPGALSALLKGADALRERGVRIGAVTQVNRQNRHALDAICDILTEHGFQGWQFQLTMPHGEAKKAGDALCLDASELPQVEETFLKIRERTDIFLQAADNFGYMGRGEAVLRGGQKGVERFYQGCFAGLSTVGITSDGTVRGCLSLPSEFDEGNIRETPLAEIWHSRNAFRYNRAPTSTVLTGVCGACPLNRICRGGCKSLCYAFTGSVSDNPYCLRRLHEGW
jgi:radical SAM protein with 4Fe4S-binding SPASM domain